MDRGRPAGPCAQHGLSGRSGCSSDLRRRSPGLPRDLIDNGEHTDPTAVLGLILEKVIRPQAVRALGPKPDAGPAVQPETTALGLPLWTQQALPPPNPSDTLVIRRSAVSPQQSVARGRSNPWRDNRQRRRSPRRPYLPARSRIAALSVSSSSSCCGVRHRADRCWPTALRARRQDRPSSRRASFVN